MSTYRPRSHSYIISAAVVTLILVLLAITFNHHRNYAAEVARPLEEALVKSGAVKKCSRGDAGRGSDNNQPNYKAIYEVPRERGGAAQLLKTVANSNGYSLSDDSANMNAEDNKPFVDRASKLSPYSNLNAGNILLFATVYGTSTYTGEGDKFCTVTKRDSPPMDKTTIDLTINLPEFKR